MLLIDNAETPFVSNASEVAFVVPMVNGPACPPLKINELLGIVVSVTLPEPSIVNRRSVADALGIPSMRRAGAVVELLPVSTNVGVLLLPTMVAALPLAVLVFMVRAVALPLPVMLNAV